MGLMNRSSPEEKDAQRQAKEAQRAARDGEKQREREATAREKLKKDFFESPGGQARVAYENQKQVLQISLNSVCDEGWELVNGSVVFLETGSESRDKFLASGQNIAVSGTIIGYYLFKRCETNRRETTAPWDAPSAVEQVAAGSEIVT